MGFLVLKRAILCLASSKTENKQVVYAKYFRYNYKMMVKIADKYLA